MTCLNSKFDLANFTVLSDMLRPSYVRPVSYQAIMGSAHVVTCWLQNSTVVTHDKQWQTLPCHQDAANGIFLHSTCKFIGVNRFQRWHFIFLFFFVVRHWTFTNQNTKHPNSHLNSACYHWWPPVTSSTLVLPETFRCCFHCWNKAQGPLTACSVSHRNTWKQIFFS